jgi:hypothetical protein
MSLAFNGSSQYLSIADNSALTLAASDFTVGGWVYLNATSGTQRIFSWGTAFANPSLNMFIVNGNHLSCPTCDATYDVTPYKSSCMTTGWQHVAIVRSGDSFVLYRNGSPLNTVTQAGFGAINVTGSWYFGTHSGTTDYLGGRLSEWFTANYAMSSTILAELASGKSIAFYPDNLALDLRMLADATERIVPLTVTDNSGGVADGPTLSYPGFAHFQRVMSGGMQAMGV